MPARIRATQEAVFGPLRSESKSPFTEIARRAADRASVHREGMGASGSTLGPPAQEPQDVRTRRRDETSRARASVQPLASPSPLVCAHKKETARSIDPNARQAVAQSPDAISRSALSRSRAAGLRPGRFDARSWGASAITDAAAGAGGAAGDAAGWGARPGRSRPSGGGGGLLLAHRRAPGWGSLRLAALRPASRGGRGSLTGPRTLQDRSRERERARSSRPSSSLHASRSSSSTPLKRATIERGFDHLALHGHRLL